MTREVDHVDKQTNKHAPAVGRPRRWTRLTTKQVEKNPTQVTCVDQTRLLVIRWGCVGEEIHLLENPLKLLKGLSLQSPGSDEKEDGEGGGVERVDTPGVEEEDIPEVGEARAAEDAHETL